MTSAKDDETDPVSHVTSPVEQVIRRTRPSGATPIERFVGWTTAFGDRAGDALVYSSAYLAAIAMVYVSITMVLLSLPPNPAPVVVALIAFAVYASDRIVDVDGDVVANPHRAAFVRRNKRFLQPLAAVSYGLAVALSVLGGVVALSITLLPGVFWILYATDWIPGGEWFQVRRLKEILIINSTVVALAWALSATFLPLAFAGVALSPGAAVVFTYFLLRSFVNTEIPNVRDIDSDRAAEVSTLPVVFGVVRTRRILYLIDGLTILLVTYSVADGLLPAVPAVALLVGLLYSLGVTSLLGRFEDVELLAIAAEFEYVVVGIAIAALLYAG